MSENCICLELIRSPRHCTVAVYKLICTLQKLKFAHVCDCSVKYVSDTRLNIYQQDQMYCARSLHVVSNRIFRVNKFRVDK